MERLHSSGFERDETFKFETNWQGIDVGISYCPRWLCSDGDELITQHIEIRSAEKTALPITGTGYRSCFLNGADALMDFDHDPVAYVLAWLDETSQAKTWKDHMEKSRQGNLFG